MEILCSRQRLSKKQHYAAARIYSFTSTGLHISRNLIPSVCSRRPTFFVYGAFRTRSNARQRCGSLQRDARLPTPLFLRVWTCQGGVAKACVTTHLQVIGNRHRGQAQQGIALRTHPRDSPRHRALQLGAVVEALALRGEVRQQQAGFAVQGDLQSKRLVLQARRRDRERGGGGPSRQVRGTRSNSMRTLTVYRKSYRSGLRATLSKHFAAKKNAVL